MGLPPFVQCAEKVKGEPKVRNAALCPNAPDKPRSDICVCEIMWDQGSAHEPDAATATDLHDLQRPQTTELSFSRVGNLGAILKVGRSCHAKKCLEFVVKHQNSLRLFRIC